LAFNFNDDSSSRFGGDSRAGSAGTTVPDESQPADTSTPASNDPSTSAGFARFNSCRWQQPKEEGTAAFCTHREVKPYAGTTGFEPDAWCPDCQYYKLRRAPKKRSPGDYDY
jgi:hypothetical protein